MTAPKKGFIIIRDAFHVPARFADYITGGKSKKPRLPFRLPAFNGVRHGVCVFLFKVIGWRVPFLSPSSLLSREG
jgi:hypothetical protein